MPHGQLTPLGRQLRSVLANLSRNTRQIHTQQYSGRRDFHDSTFTRRAPKNNISTYEPLLPGTTTSEKKSEHGNQHGLPPQSPTEQQKAHYTAHKYARLAARLNNDELTNAIMEAAQDAPQYRKQWSDLLMRSLNPGEGSGSELAIPMSKKNSSRAGGVTVQSILARYIRDVKGERDPLRAGWETSFEPEPLEHDFLRRNGLNVHDLEDWADILLASDSTNAAENLAVRLDKNRGTPLFVYLLILRREYISAEALRTLICAISDVLQASVNTSKPQPDRRHLPSLLVAIVRLIRHAREVWPQSFSAIVSLFTAYNAYFDAASSATIEDTQHLTYALNKIMSLVSLSTAVRPFKDNPFQEMAIIHVLRYMDAHDPPLQITRPGYRAVVRVQLGQRKTSDEQQWAELKALSWPPWKVDRTAMDADVTLEYGISRARATLISMRAAGYAPLAWEKAAETYAGWDIDGTPTVQRRVAAVLGSGVPYRSNPTDRPSTPNHSNNPSNSSTSHWPARIDSTRTIQEAWACYLAWEDAKLPPDQRVYLAILQKLYEQDNHPPEEDESSQQSQEQEEYPPQILPSWDLLPGDTPRLSPLPPSTHLYTYTRTRPPSMVEFYNTLRSQGVEFAGHTLAYLIRNASSLVTGLGRIQDHLAQHPSLGAFLNLDTTHDISLLPGEIFTAAMILLARSGGYFLDSKAWRAHRSRLNKEPISNHDPEAEVSRALRNTNSVIIRAIALLYRNPACGRQTWVAVFEGLTRDSHLTRIGQGFDEDFDHISGSELPFVRERDVHPPVEFQFLGAQLSYGLTRRLSAMYRKQFSDLDSSAFLRVCWVTERMVHGVWRVSCFEGSGLGDAQRRVRRRTEEWDYFNRYIQNMAAAKHLRQEFQSLVGAREETVEIYGGEMLPRLLHIPGPAMLHAYVRALGFAGDFEGIAETVRWMSVYREEIEERMERDRLGRSMFRKAVIAVRVFMERSWRIGETGRTVQDWETPDPLERGGRAGRLGAMVEEKLGASADEALVKEIRELVDTVQGWEGWADDQEVQDYCQDYRFDGLRG